MGQAVGVDIGGTGIKAALVDTATGQLLSERVKLLTPEGGEPKPIIATVLEVLKLVPDAERAPIGVAFPAIVKNGRTLSAGNVSPKWVGLDAERRFEEAIGRDVHFINDADAAGYAELHYGAATGVDGLVILTTLGTGIGSAFIYNGVLQPNVELGFLEMDRKPAEYWASYRAKERDDLDWAAWVERLQRFYSHVERLFTPDLFIIGGGVSKNADQFLPLLQLATPTVVAVHRNNAGILGAAALATM